MLGAYLDDSGTHDDSKWVAFGGVVGFTEDWTAFDGRWRGRLAQPLFPSETTKPPLTEMKMAHCEGGYGEFGSYTRPEREFIAGEMRKLILTTELRGFSFVLERASWEQQARPIMGDTDAEEAAFSETLKGVIATASRLIRAKGQNPSEECLAVVVDERTARKKDFCNIYKSFKRNNLGTLETPKLVSFSMGDSATSPALQAADMLAYETYRMMADRPQQNDARAGLLELEASGRFAIGAAGPAQIKETVAAWREAAKQPGWELIQHIVENPGMKRARPISWHERRREKRRRDIRQYATLPISNPFISGEPNGKYWFLTFTITNPDETLVTYNFRMSPDDAMGILASLEALRDHFKMKPFPAEVRYMKLPKEAPSKKKT